MAHPLSTPPPAPLESDSAELLSNVPTGASTPAPDDRLRAAARELDRDCRGLQAVDAERAIRLWDGLLRGHWKLIDWFDSEGRRFIIAKLNPARPGCARGLTDRERQVALCAALGESSKSTSYRLGISPSRVSALLRAAMRKLGVRTKVQLVVMVRLLNGQRSINPYTTGDEASRNA